MHTIDAQAVHWDSPRYGVCDASDLGLTPGQWPDQVEVVEIADGSTLYQRRFVTRDETGAAKSATYRHAGRDRTLTVYND